MMANSGQVPETRRSEVSSVGVFTTQEDEADVGTAPSGLVDPSRWILSEKTNMEVFPSALSMSLEYFYDELVEVSSKRHDSAVSKAEAIMDHVMPRIKNLAIQNGLKITKYVKAGSTFDNTQVVLPREVDIFVLFDSCNAKVTSKEPGYSVIPLKKFHQKEGSPPDQWRYGRAEGATYLSSKLVAECFYELVGRALRLYPQTELKPFVLEAGKCPITVCLKKKFNISLIPAIYAEGEEMYLTVRPYSYDQDPGSDKMWRQSYFPSERKIMERIDQADRGMRRKAFKVLKTLVRVEPSLGALTSYHVKTILLHTFDSTVDSTPRWQRTSLETCFLGLLKELHRYLTEGNMPHFFVERYNLLGNMPPRAIASARMRVAYLLANHNELVRVLRKRAQ